MFTFTLKDYFFKRKYDLLCFVGLKKVLDSFTMVSKTVCFSLAIVAVILIMATGKPTSDDEIGR